MNIPETRTEGNYYLVKKMIMSHHFAAGWRWRWWWLSGWLVQVCQQNGTVLQTRRRNCKKKIAAWKDRQLFGDSSQDLSWEDRASFINVVWSREFGEEEEGKFRAKSAELQSVSPALFFRIKLSGLPELHTVEKARTWMEKLKLNEVSFRVMLCSFKGTLLAD